MRRNLAIGAETRARPPAKTGEKRKTYLARP